MKKMRKLFLFIIHFGSDALTFSRKCIVLIKGEPTSNILDLLEAAVTGRFSEEPFGYQDSLGALKEINVGPNEWGIVCSHCTDVLLCKLSNKPHSTEQKSDFNTDEVCQVKR